MYIFFLTFLLKNQEKKRNQGKFLFLHPDMYIFFLTFLFKNQEKKVTVAYG